MNTKLSTSMLRALLGLSTLLAVTGQAVAATLHESVVRIQSVPVNVKFDSDFFAQQSWSCWDCQYSIPEQPYYGNLLPSFSQDNKYSIPEKPNYGNLSPIVLASIFEVKKQVVEQRGEMKIISLESSQLQQPWGNSFIKPRTVFKGKDGWTDNRWANHNHDEELNSGLTDWDDGSNVSPVPEADEWVLMLAGFSVIGFVAYRRKRNERYSAT